MLTSRNEIVDFSISSEDFLYSHPSSDEETENETEKPGAIGRLGLIEIEQISEDFPRSTDISDVPENSKSQRDEKTSTSRLDELLHEIDHQLGVRIIVSVGGVEQPPQLDEGIVSRSRCSGFLHVS